MTLAAFRAISHRKRNKVFVEHLDWRAAVEALYQTIAQAANITGEL